MIRINLLAPERPTEKKKKASAGVAAAPGAFQAYLLLTLFAGGAFFLCAALWWLQAAKLRELDASIRADEKRKSDLKAIEVQVVAVQRKKTPLLDERRLALEQGL